VAVTSLWRVTSGGLNKVVVYATNPDKTVDPEPVNRHGATQKEWLSSVIHYATQEQKTQAFVHDEQVLVMRQFVTGVNCNADTARDEMVAVKLKYGKTDGVIAYHGYQSFAPGEAAPEMAHEIGVKLAVRLWGEKYQVLVATHLDKANHLHNHFVINTVSYIDGIKFHRTNEDYRKMQRESDALCREYGLSVIAHPQRGKTKHYSEWGAERDGYQTWRGMVKADVDTAIRRSMTERQFFDNLRNMGYEIKSGKDISVRPPGKERFVRLQRNFGDGYAIEGIRKRILAQNQPEREATRTDPLPRKTRLKGVLHKPYYRTGLRSLYLYYLYRMGAYPKKREPNPKKVYFLFREDIRYVQRISQEARLLVKYGIDTDLQLIAHKDSLTAQITALSNQRKHLRNKSRIIKDEGQQAVIKNGISELSSEIGGLRKEVKLCCEIERRSSEMADKIKRAREDDITIGKEPVKNEQFRGRR